MVYASSIKKVGCILKLVRSVASVSSLYCSITVTLVTSSKWLAVMGIDPKTVKYLTIADEKGLGVSSLEEIQVLGERIEDVKKQFRV